MNKKETNEIEILSPAGNPECFYAALNNGADAIYLGLSNFNARMKAENFTTQNIRNYTSTAHLFGAKVYVTVNTLVEEDEFDELLNLIKALIEAKVDAFIVQDLGVAYLLKNCFPGIVLHASTQMGIHNLNGAKIAEKLGFTRIVLSRETKLEDIKQIHKNTNLEIEYFVQGALCVAFSGNCYLSSIEHNASGNKGKCLQLCRLPYKNSLTNETKYYLSPRDLCLLPNLKSLKEAGVTSLKIEGRMRHSGYVATATNVYKTAVTKILSSNLTNEETGKFIDELKVSFSRGEFNHSAYLSDATPENIIFPDYQNHIGQKIGTTLAVSPFKNNLTKVKIKTDYEIFEGDGLKFIDEKNKVQVASLGIGNINKLSYNTYEIFTKNNISSGLSVFLTQSASNEKLLLEKSRRIPLSLNITANANSPLAINATSCGCEVTLASSVPLEKAQNQPLSKDDFRSQFSKLSDTYFQLENITINTNGVFIPKSVLNQARRDVVALISEKIIEKNEKNLNATFDEAKYEELKQQQPLSNPKNISIIDDSWTDFEYDKVYIFAVDSFNSKNVIKTIKNNPEKQFGIMLPTIQNHKDTELIEKILEQIPKTTYLYISNIGGLIYKDYGFNIISSPLMNIKNTFAIKLLNSLQVTTICASIECTESFAQKNKLIWWQDGKFPLMTFAHCPFKTINNNTCNKCSYSGGLSFSSNGKSYEIHRTKISNCYFELLKPISRQKSEFNIINFAY